MGSIAKQFPILAILASGIAGIIVGLIVGIFAGISTPEDYEPPKPHVRHVTLTYTDLMKQVNKENIKHILQELSKEPHMSGTPRAKEVAELLQSRYLEYGFDSCELTPYDILLSHPDPENPNVIKILNERQESVFTSHFKEEPILPDDGDPNFVDAFVAYTPAGNVTTSPGYGVVYANYGQVEDFDLLEQVGVNVTGHVVMARYGSIFRGNKVKNAYERGAIGVILFSDPKDVALNGTDASSVYPNSWWLPGTGIQRGSAFIDDGDPLTPGWPSVANAYRIRREDADLPKLVTQPIGYEDAQFILSKLGGFPSPEGWHGGIENVSYRLGPEFLPDFSGFSLQISSHNVDSIKTVYNVIASLRGKDEPDRYVLFGNHIDAWGYGAIDPSSGTAELMEVARILGRLHKEGWQPRRTVIFCGWGAEEYGLAGSTEFVEENFNKIQDRVVAYINSDICAAGDAFQSSASPQLWDLAMKIAKEVPGVKNAPRQSLYEEWRQNSRQSDPESPEWPRIGTLGSGSDYAPFVSAGVAALDFTFFPDKTKYPIGMYPSYHTGYETFFMVESLMDPGFVIHESCSRFALAALLSLAEEELLPFNLTRYPSVMKNVLQEYDKEGFRDILLNITGNFAILEEAVDDLLDATIQFHRDAEAFNGSDLHLRAINDQLSKFERNFISPNGLPGRPLVKHAIFAPSLHNSYAASGFPGLSDFLHRYNSLTGPERPRRDEAIRRHVADLVVMVTGAKDFLRPSYSL